MASPDFMKLKSAIVAYLDAVDQKRGWQSVDDGRRVVLADAQRREQAVLDTRSALQGLLSHQSAYDEMPEAVTHAFNRLDEAMRDHLRDCWLGSDDGDATIDGRARAVRQRESDLMDAVRNHVGRHARKFEEQAKLNRVQESGEHDVEA